MAAKQLKQQIRSQGLSVSELPDCYFKGQDLRRNLEDVFARLDATTNHTRVSKSSESTILGSLGVTEDFPAVHACGDRGGASYYATVHNRLLEPDCPLIIAFKASIEDVFIDGADFLNSAFNKGPCDGLREVILRCFGAKIAKYLDRAWNSKDQDLRVWLCTLAKQDPEVVVSHHRNKVLLGGRCDTIFRSAFIVRLPVTSDRILSVYEPAPFRETPEFFIYDFQP
jgi:hypothetical protein